MPFKIVRNDIVKMNTEAIVNTASAFAAVGEGCDSAVYKAAGYEELLAYRKEHIGYVEEGDAFLTPGFKLSAKYIIHAVSPLYVDGKSDEEKKLRSCYKKSLAIAKEHGIKSIAFPLISTGNYGYPKEEAMRIAADEINAFLMKQDMEIYLVVFDTIATLLGERIYPDLEAYIDYRYVVEKRAAEYKFACRSDAGKRGEELAAYCQMRQALEERLRRKNPERFPDSDLPDEKTPAKDTDYESLQAGLEERMKHAEDTFSEYLLYLIKRRGMKNAEVYKRAIVDKKIFSKIKNNSQYHPQKITALCLCVGAKLSLEETKELLSRAGFALSPCDKMDIIFSYFIENKIYDMIEIDIQLEEHGLPCIIV